MPPDPAPETRDYIAEQARTRTIEQVIELVEADTVRLHEAARSFPAADLERPLDGDWTPLACVAHIVERSMLRAREVLYVAVSGELPPEEDVSLPGDLDGLLATHREAIDSLYAHVREAPDDFKSFEWSHPFFGAMTWPEWLVFIHVHIADHAGQLGRMAVLASGNNPSEVEVRTLSRSGKATAVYLRALREGLPKEEARKLADLAFWGPGGQPPAAPTSDE